MIQVVWTVWPCGSKDDGAGQAAHDGEFLTGGGAPTYMEFGTHRTMSGKMRNSSATSSIAPT